MRLYHNPRCSKSRQARNLLTERGVDFEEYRYLDSGIHPDDLELLATLDGILRISDLDSETDVDFGDNEAVAELISVDPRLLQRPILIFNGVAVIGRPPESILTLLP
ncbi:MAG: arsenate reductase family protein [Candidatus Poseidoniaceae archaeon]